MPVVLKRFEETEKDFILRLRNDQTTVMFDPHYLHEHLLKYGVMPKVEEWKYPLIYSAFIHVMELGLGDDTLIPMKKNPREQNIKSTPSRRIARSLKNTDIAEDERPHNKSFYLLNRGIVLVAHKIKFIDNVIFIGEDEVIPNVIEIIMDKENEGNIDGGHTYKIIKDTVMNIKKNEDFLDAYVRFEITVNFHGVSRLAEARNTSAQVLSRSIVNLQGGFDILKELISELPFHDRVAYKQFEKHEEGLKMIPVENIIRLLDLFNLEKNPKYSTLSKFSRRPSIPQMKWASGAEQIIKSYVTEIETAAEEERDSEYVKMEQIIPDIFSIYSYLEKNIPEIYNKVGSGNSTGGGNYALISFSKSDKKVLFDSYRNITTFSNGNLIDENGMKYDVPGGLIQPIIGSLRMLVMKKDDGQYEWINGFDPNNHQELEEIVQPLVSYVVTKAREETPDKVAKSNEHWNYCLMTIDQTKSFIEGNNKNDK
ncbi:AIPR family protein [Bacillus sp. DTU_2020_1000418_1_SI_GHA_SEK_038]|uniref:AIPR family protein n=1 Tax=Bacillus sp. DTU_2020_1000418_1_SI_GHA_SEK_038 TaxID=3077585 RepID=UPI0028EBB4D4|nr:AIPR family protein [Bacillus sp. DTU_2020_1000418_1_SI_GHA_SEK_038]WNS75476.1 AIPR family protein [Bacillus sp. DTU_2020_1000418_1_SI_GHA_SEK_038]